MDDKQNSIRLLTGISNGSLEAFDQFYEVHVEFVLRITKSIIKDQAEAEDVCHDVFLEVYQNPQQYKEEKGSVKAWLAVKTRSRCLDRLRRKKPVLLNKLENLLTKQEIDAEMSVLSQLERETVLEALKYIPKEQQQVIYGAYFEGKTQSEMAKSLNRPIGSIKSLVRYGLKNLRKQNILLYWAEPSGGEKKHEI
ncbi:sigma-70 family RNA polymerase sigma factor [Aquibacillus sp. 3ASR75-11]|uniref:Sigma-70 family RNA polymerase sigma factor n=1 Tax=Terrihalobacillus insolitus TaxID=2950438 RepID=A0A9X3WT61_9BACI|nr:sigma-70 family RNA polymerase sigma factor [Terrihalobacillus insolitus]MDC3413469.1 sigma-70 family RNA polymerase sigma factor [Terrihalobacillus insolitus]MDC3425240.1 sigma-70 family RNA polymerase sigma factor [Terrihalobacillus insolitus]